MLLHEMAHLKRRDPLLRAACRMLACLYWINPLVWIATRRIAALAELCCDARVAAALGPRREGYRRTLLRGARFLLEPRRDLASAALGFHGGASLLAQRLAWMERPSARPGPVRRLLAGALVAAAALLIVPMGFAPATPPGPDEAAILQARLLLQSAASGKRVSSLRLQHAARVLSASQTHTTPPQGD
jgi:beta-lactamase regulating signal transducer with metallopeptidase domain